MQPEIVDRNDPTRIALPHDVLCPVTQTNPDLNVIKPLGKQWQKLIAVRQDDSVVEQMCG